MEPSNDLDDILEVEASAPKKSRATITTEAGDTLYAGFWKRFAALIIDACVMAVPQMVVGFIFGLSFSSRFSDEATGAVAFQIMAKVFGILVAWVYFAAMESSKYQGTIGKIVLGIKVTDMNGRSVEFAKATGRFFGRFLSAVLMGIGFIMVAFTARKQALHDIMAGCLVINRQPTNTQNVSA